MRSADSWQAWCIAPWWARLGEWRAALILLEMGLNFCALQRDARPGEPGVAQGQHAYQEDTSACARKRPLTIPRPKPNSVGSICPPPPPGEQSQRTKLGASLPTAAPTIPPATPAASVHDITATIA